MKKFKGFKIWIIVFLLNSNCLLAQTNQAINNKDVDTILQLYYSQIFIDSSMNCKSKYKLLPESIEVQLWERVDSNEIKSHKLNYNPVNFYSTLDFEKRIFNASEKEEIINFLGKGFIIDNPTDMVNDLTIKLKDSTVFKYKEIQSEFDIKYQVKFNKEHGVIFNLAPEWIFESDFTTSFIIFQDRVGCISINLSNWRKKGWAYFIKENGKWKLRDVKIIGFIGY